MLFEYGSSVCLCIFSVAFGDQLFDVCVNCNSVHTCSGTKGGNWPVAQSGATQLFSYEIKVIMHNFIKWYVDITESCSWCAADNDAK